MKEKYGSTKLNSYKTFDNAAKKIRDENPSRKESISCTDRGSHIFPSIFRVHTFKIVGTGPNVIKRALGNIVTCVVILLTKLAKRPLIYSIINRRKIVLHGERRQSPEEAQLSFEPGDS